MPSAYRVEHLHQPSGWLSPGYVTVNDNGIIVDVSCKRPPSSLIPTEQLTGFAVPGFPNLHSHAFQRAIAGRFESTVEEESNDNLWSWRQLMYDFVSRVQPEDYEAIAAFVYLEMVKHGITTVGEFHYVHHPAEHAPYDNPAEMSDRLISAADKVGLCLTILPVLYTQGGLGEPPTQLQQRFVHSSIDDFLKLFELVRSRRREHPRLEVGVALHSLRAVSSEEIADGVTGSLELDPDCRIHIHISEHWREVEQCIHYLGSRPAQWLLDNVGLNPQWTTVHATHVDEIERRALAKSGVVVGLCPVTEATLGDGIFPLLKYQQENGRWGIGTDSHYTASHAEELRVLEYGQRLSAGRRNVLAVHGNPLTAHSGRRLFDLALAGGSHSIQSQAGALIQGCHADLVLLDPRCPTLLGHGPDTVIDAWILSGTTNPVRDVMVGGRWIVRDGRHKAEGKILADYERALNRLMLGRDCSTHGGHK